jgi:CheY-like chemotaxis protein
MSGDQKKILVIEDNLETQLLIKVALRNKYKLELTNNAGDAIKKINEGSFDLVLLDINLNDEMDGKDILSHIRTNFNIKQVPVIVMTAYDLTDGDKKFFIDNCNGLIAKPLDKKVLMNEIEKLNYNSGRFEA